MTKEEYARRFARKGVIGLCELCRSFHCCASLDQLKESGCNHHSNFSEDEDV